MKTWHSHSLEETKQIAKEWLGALMTERDSVPASDVSAEATVIGLNGHLGSGKTAFVQAIAAELGVKEFVTSPTFVIMKIYGINNSSWKRLVHIDAYRLEKGAELEALNFEQLVRDRNNLILIEWAENVAVALPESTKTMSFEYVSENERKISY